MTVLIGENIKKLRKAMDVSQEKLAEAVGVTVQAVSKWENSTSLPDIGIVPEIAAFFGVTLDELFFGVNEIKTKKSAELNLPVSDNKLYVLLSQGGKILNQQEWEDNKRIFIELGRYENNIEVEIKGNADIKGDIRGHVTEEGGVNCGNVSGGVDSNGGVNCGNISGGVDANGGVVCGNISGGVDATGGVVCGNISGGVDANGGVQCGDISGEINCEGDIRCNKVVKCDTLCCDSIYVKGDINCRNIESNVHIEKKTDFDF